MGTAPWIYVTLYLLLIFVRVRWFNLLLLTAGLLFYGLNIVAMPLHA